jgi:hypothetical protein
MSNTPGDPRRRAESLLRWYPREWRARYGEEFGELLIAQMADQPRSSTRTADVAIGGIMARLAALGLSGSTVDPLDQPRRSLVASGCALAVFLIFAVSIWSQLIIASRWSRPATTATRTAVVLMTVAVIICLAAAAGGVIPVAWSAAVATARRQVPGLLRPAAFFSLGAAVLVVGGLHFRSGWADGDGHPLAHQSAGPGGAAAFMWASTLAVSAYWAHPAVLLSFPPSEVAWMVLSPLALILAVTEAVQTIRELELSRGLLRFVRYMAGMALCGSGLFLFGTITWLVDGGPGPDNLYQAGTVDVVGLAVMGTAVVVALRSTQRAALTPSLTAH